MGLDPASYEALEKDFQEVMFFIQSMQLNLNSNLGSPRVSGRSKYGEIQKRI